MKKGFLALIVFFGLGSHGIANAATPVTDAMAQKYFENCLAGAQKEGTMTAATQKKILRLYRHQYAEINDARRYSNPYKS